MKHKDNYLATKINKKIEMDEKIEQKVFDFSFFVTSVI